MSIRKALFRRRTGVALLAVAVLAVTCLGVTSATASTAGSTQKAKPTVVLVHGAWADSGSWDGVVERLQSKGYPVDVFPTPLQSLSGDSSALEQYLAAINGPIVLVGHSYGGAVITNAATGDAQVKVLVYIDAFAPAQGESVISLPGPNSVLANPNPAAVFQFVPNAAPTPGTEFYVLPSVFPSAFANDLPARQAAVLAATQRPVTLAALAQPSGVPAWTTIPSWYEVGTIDHVIPPDVQVTMATRAHSHIVKVKSGHLPMVSHPRSVDRVIEEAASETA